MKTIFISVTVATTCGLVVVADSDSMLISHQQRHRVKEERAKVDT